MPGFTSYDNIIGLITVSGFATDYTFYKTSPTAQAQGVPTSLWYGNGDPGPGALCAPTSSGTVYVSHSSGGFYYPNVSPAQRYLTSFGATTTLNTALALYDRLVGVNISLVSAGVKACDHFPLPRYPSGNDVQAWVEVTTATATSAAVLRLSGYTNQDGVTGQVGPTVTFPAAVSPISMMVQLPLATGDTGIRALGNIQVTTAPSAGAANIILIKPLSFIGIFANLWTEKDCILQLTSLPRVYDGATLGMYIVPNATTVINIYGQLRTVYG